MKNRLEAIKSKGFEIRTENDTDTIQVNDAQTAPTDFSKIKIGIKTLEDAVFTPGEMRKAHPRFCSKHHIIDALWRRDYEQMRAISQFFYNTSGIYQRLCRYMAYMYRYDWIVTPYINQQTTKTDKLISGFNEVLNFLDKFEVKRFLGQVALKVVKYGCYYGYVVDAGDRIMVQQLLPRYCRSRFLTAEGRPAIQFNMRYFDDMFKDAKQRMRMLKLFPQEFAKGYIAYKSGRLVPDFPGDTSGWYLLDAACAIKFNINGEDIPMFMSVIPALTDLDDAQGLDKKKLQQQLLKILIQKMPIDKNGDLVFDVDEAQMLHNNAVRMLSKAIGIDVLTTFADVSVEDMAEDSSTTTDDAMDRIKDAVYDQAGVSQMQFNTDGNIALEKSILNDEATLYNLIQQFESFLNMIIAPFNKNPKKISYRVQILTTTIYNYQDIAKAFKEGMQLGYSKMLYQIALGQSQSAIMANAYFENDILDLVNVFIPPLMSSTMNAESVQTLKSGGKIGGDKQVGRPEKEDSQKSEKTIQNKESAN